jgi:hypothetical protein
MTNEPRENTLLPYKANSFVFLFVKGKKLFYYYNSQLIIICIFDWLTFFNGTNTWKNWKVISKKSFFIKTNKALMNESIRWFSLVDLAI